MESTGATGGGEEGGDGEGASTWPPLYALLYSIDDHATREYFPLELGDADYAVRILRTAAHVLREVYRQIREQDLTPPCLEEGRIVEPQNIDNKRLFSYILSAQVPPVYAKLLKIEVESLMHVVRVLALGEADMLKPPLPMYWTALKVRRLFDAGLRVVQAAAEGGFCQWASLNLSCLRSQYKQHMTYRDERYATIFPHGPLMPKLFVDKGGRRMGAEAEDVIDEGWGAFEESAFWRPASPVAVVKSKAARAREQNEDLQKELAVAARAKHLQKVENWEAMFGKLPPMEMSNVDDGTCERLRLALQGRLTMMHQVKRKRESEALMNRQKQYQDAKTLREQLDQDLLPKLRGFEEQVAALWKDVAPAELVDSVAAMERDSQTHAQDAANARDYITARTLTEAKERLTEARKVLERRKQDAYLMEEAASRFSIVAVMREDVQEVGSAATRLGTAGDMLQHETQPPHELIGKAQRLDLSIQKWVHKWNTEKKNEQSNNGSSHLHTPTSGASNSVPPSPTGSQSSGRGQQMDERILTPTETNDRLRVDDIVSMNRLADDLAGALKRLRWREKICGFIQREIQAESHASSTIDPLHSNLQSLLEAIHGAAAQSISARIIASMETKLEVFRLMDDRPKLLAAAKQQADMISGTQNRQRKRWEGLEYTVLNNWFVRIIGSWGTGDSQFRDPCGVAIAPNGDFWVADRGNHRVHHLDASGKVLRMIGYRGKIEGQLENPSGIAVSPDGQSVYVADRGNNRVVIFNLDGACTGIIGAGAGKERGYMQGPCGVAVRSNGQVAVCDYGNNRIQIFSAEGKCISTLGDSTDPGSMRQRLLQPSAVCYDRQEQVVVADYGNQRVVIFKEDGTVCQELVGGWGGVSSESFNGPCAVATGGNGEILVADQGNHRVLVFGRDGGFVRSFGFKGHEPGRLHNPRGLAMGAHNVFAVADYGNHRIVVAEFGEV